MPFKACSHTLYKELDGEAVALNLQTGQYYSLNEVAARMWALLLELDSSQEIITAIMDEYEVTQEAAEGDLEQLIKDLKNSGLVEET